MSKMSFDDPSLVLICTSDVAGCERVLVRAVGDSKVVSRRRELLRLADDEHERGLLREAERMVAGLVANRLAQHRPTVVVCGPSTHDWKPLAAQADKASVPTHLVVVADGDGHVDDLATRARGGELSSLVRSARVVEAKTDLSALRFGTDHLRRLDVIGDVHGCLTELRTLLGRLGYVDLDASPRHPEGRVAVFVGDLVGEHDTVEVVELVARMVRHGAARLGALGNHDAWLLRALVHHKLGRMHGSRERVLRDCQAAGPQFVETVRELLLHAPAYSTFDEGRLVVTHGALRPRDIGRRPTRERDDDMSELCMYGERGGPVDERGLRTRTHEWMRLWDQDERVLVFGHDLVGSVPRSFGPGERIVGVDCGCSEGGALAALRWPERESVTVPSTRVSAGPITSELAAA